jgi:hypothetical protein
MYPSPVPLTSDHEGRQRRTSRLTPDSSRDRSVTGLLAARTMIIYIVPPTVYLYLGTIYMTCHQPSGPTAGHAEQVGGNPAQRSISGLEGLEKVQADMKSYKFQVLVNVLPPGNGAARVDLVPRRAAWLCEPGTTKPCAARFSAP